MLEPNPPFSLTRPCKKIAFYVHTLNFDLKSILSLVFDLTQEKKSTFFVKIVWNFYYELLLKSLPTLLMS